MVIYEASVSGVIKIIFYFLLFSFIIRLIMRMALPYVVKKGEQAMKERAGEFYRQHEPQRKEGEVTIENSKRKSREKDDNDEYVDYIEIRN
ncbi:MAG: hypothetical protein IT223_00765 [Crocinitomicaceae bacterium]|nr:hypothetical protein [Crocinitomicaceae bacterium]